MIPAALIWCGLASATPALSPDAVDMGFHLAAGGATNGLWARVSTDLGEPGGWTPTAGLSMGLFGAGQGYIDGETEGTGGLFEAHLHAHLALAWRGAARRPRSVELGLYGGGYLYRSSGSWTQHALDLTHESTNQVLLPDWGPRIAVGQGLSDRLTLQLSVADSMRRLSASEGLLGGVLTMDADAKLVLGLELRMALGGA
ncbi:MAG: hypothetical protein JXX28_01980 [Deltaproteobacteria bacterium]|nr:hypothetical protein [Deltaproteobacteria bacterium]